MKTVNAPVSPVKVAPVSQIKNIKPKIDCDSKKCEARLNIGLFFDGTNNNRDRDRVSLSDTNIARLYDAYNSNAELGYYRVYIPGVGTRFPEIGENDESKLGTGCAFGCEGRVIFGLLSVLNFLHQKCFKAPFFDADVVLALCRNDSKAESHGDREHLAKFGVEGGLLQSSIGSDSDRREFLTKQCSVLTEKLKSGKPRVLECLIDVFGFSRGAAEARVFCTWLNELLIGGRLAGVVIQFRFVGIIDTVASAGFWSGTTALVMNSTGGHGAWASAEALKIPAVVQNCVHMVAMHELRRNFPLDEIGINGKLQSGCIQYAYPGAHSDVGGGYRPGELGLAVGDDSLKLSQIPLNHMFECAVAAGSPLSRPLIKAGERNPFAIHPELARAFDAFISESKLLPCPIYEWLQPYLNWRWQVRNDFHKTIQVKQAIPAEQEILIAFNRSLVYDASVIERMSKPIKKISYRLIAMRSHFQPEFETDMSRIKMLEPEAQSVLELAKKAKRASASHATLFEYYVHDSLAGFNAPNLERPGYWRYRKVFLGTDDPVIAANQTADLPRNVG